MSFGLKRGFRFAAAMAMLAVGTAVPAGVRAQAYPTKPVRLLVGFPAGGSTDLLARTLAPKLAQALGQPVIIENRPGAGGNIAGEATAKSAPDGYTLFMTTVASHAINPHLYSKMPYDAVKDFTPVTLAASYPLLLVAYPGSGANSVAALLQLAKAKPGNVFFSSSGNGSPGHLAGELFRSMGGVNIVHVPYKGGAPSTTAVLAGEAQISFQTMPAVLPHVKAGKLLGVAVTTAQRSPAAPEIPTISESGLTGYDVSSWAGVVGPAGLPRPIVQRLQSEFAKVLHSAEVKERLAAEGASPIGNQPGEFAAFIVEELAKWGKTARDANAKIE
jgi:tripartite-type tricarboxylate transporter receptor subunit TctC